MSIHFWISYRFAGKPKGAGQIESRAFDRTRDGFMLLVMGFSRKLVRQVPRGERTDVFHTGEGSIADTWFLRYYQLAEMYCVSMNSSIPSCPPSRPSPDCLVPPNGAAGSEIKPRLRPTMP